MNGTKVIATRAEGVKGKDLRAMVDDLRDKLRSGVVLLASESDGKVSLALGVTPDLKGQAQGRGSGAGGGRRGRREGRRAGRLCAGWW